MLIVGSTAASIHFDDFRSTEKSDIDVHIHTEETPEQARELLNSFIPGSDTRRIEIKTMPLLAGEVGSISYASPVELYTLKLSHCFWNIRWGKTMFDILFFQQKGIRYDRDLFKQCYDFWVELHGKKKAYLDVKNDEFFTATVKRVYVHDDLHRLVAYYDEPLYTKIKYDQERAMVHQELFERLSYLDQLRLCREEIYVTALERFLIPQSYRYPLDMAYRKACCQLITSMSKGWFPLFIASHWQVLHRPEPGKLEGFITQLLAGKEFPRKVEDENVRSTMVSSTGRG